MTTQDYPDDYRPFEYRPSVTKAVQNWTLFNARKGVFVQQQAEILGLNNGELDDWLEGRSEPDTIWLLRTFLHNENIEAKTFAIICLQNRAPEVFSPATRFAIEFSNSLFHILDQSSNGFLRFIDPVGKAREDWRTFFTRTGDPQ